MACLADIAGHLEVFWGFREAKQRKRRPIQFFIDNRMMKKVIPSCEFHIFLVPEGADLKVIEMEDIDEIDHYYGVSTARATRTYFVSIEALLEGLDRPLATRADLIRNHHFVCRLVNVFSAPDYASTRQKCKRLSARIRAPFVSASMNAFSPAICDFLLGFIVQSIFVCFGTWTLAGDGCAYGKRRLQFGGLA